MRRYSTKASRVRSSSSPMGESQPEVGMEADQIGPQGEKQQHAEGSGGNRDRLALRQEDKQADGDVNATQQEEGQRIAV